MGAGDYTPMFAKFILSCKEEWVELCERIDEGGVPAHHSVTIRIEIPSDDVDRIRFERIVEAANG